MILSALLVSCKEQKNIDVNANMPENGISDKSDNQEALKPVKDPNAFSIDGKLPDIGEFSGNKDYGSYHDKPTYTFVPSKEYLSVLPYIGRVKDFELIKKVSYGLCDENGKVIMDDSYDVSYVGYTKSNDGFGYYNIMKSSGEGDEIGKTLIVPEDGSFVIDAGNGWCTGANDGIISISYADYENHEFSNDFYDYDGKLLFSVDGYSNVGCFSSGLISAWLWEDDESYVYFLNKEGERVLGPYRWASDFTKEGVTIVRDYSDEVFIIDTMGRRLTDTKYNNFTINYDENEINNRDGKICFVMDRADDPTLHDVYGLDGKLTGTIEANGYASFYFTNNGEILYSYNDLDTNEMVWKRMSDGSDFVSKEFGFAPNSYVGDKNCYIYCDDETATAYVFDGNGETIAVIDDCYSEDILLSENGKYLVYTKGEFSYSYNPENDRDEIIGDCRLNILNIETGEVVYEDNDLGYAMSVGENGRYIFMHFYNGNSFALFDTKTGEMLFDDCVHISANRYGEKWYYSISTTNSCTLYDGDMNVIRRTYYE